MKIYSFPMRGAQVDFLLLSACFVFCLLGFGALLGLLCKIPACDAVAHGADLSVFRTGRLFLAAYGNAGFSGTDCKLSAVTHYLGPVRSIILMGIGFERTSLQQNRAMLLTLGIGAFVLSLAVFVWQLCRAEKKQKAAEKNTQTEGVQA